MTRIHLLEIVYQRRATPPEIREDGKRKPDKRSLTGYQRGAVKMKNFREFVTVDIPVGGIQPGTETLRRVLLRAVVANLEPEYEQFYAIAHFKDDNGDEFSRTVMPRTEITFQLRGLRYRNEG